MNNSASNNIGQKGAQYLTKGNLLQLELLFLNRLFLNKIDAGSQNRAWKAKGTGLIFKTWSYSYLHFQAAEISSSVPKTMNLIMPSSNVFVSRKKIQKTLLKYFFYVQMVAYPNKSFSFDSPALTYILNCYILILISPIL